MDVIEPQPITPQRSSRFGRGYLISTVALTVILIAAGWFTGTRIEAAAPTLSSASITDAQLSVATDATLSFTMNTTIAGASLYRSNWSTLLITEDLQEVYFTNSSIGWAVGANETLYTTFDGGSNWFTRSSIGSGNVYIYGLSFANPQTGWAVGGAGKILKTMDGGTSWSNQMSGTSNALNAVSFVDSNTGWAIGNSGTIVKTTNGGTTWTAQTSGTSVPLNGAHFIDANTGYIVGGQMGPPVILKTTDGGTTWTTQTSGAIAGLVEVHCTDSNTCWIGGLSGIILKTTNGGTTWAAQTSGITSNLAAVHFFDANTGWMVGAAGIILKTTNGGTTWTAQTSGITGDLGGLHFVDASTGWAVGAQGRILKTTNGGTTWTTQVSGSSNINDTLGGVWATGDGGAVWIVGGSGTILKSTNDGKTWTSLVSGTTQELNDIHVGQVSGQNIGYIVGNGGTILKSSDGGTTWTALTSGTTEDLRDVFFINDLNTVWTVGNNFTALKSTNGGTSWTAMTLSGGATHQKRVFMVDANTGWIAKSSIAAWKTTDGGTTWTDQNISSGSNAINDIVFVDSNGGFGIGDNGTILKTTNGGTSWSSQTSGTTVQLNKIFCVTSSVCWIVGNGGGQNAVILRTTDAGATWIADTSGGNSDLLSLFVGDERGAWAVGRNATLMMPNRNVMLGANTGNTRSGSVAGQNLCTSLSFESQGAFAAGTGRTLTCNHSALSPGTWYTLIAVGGSGGITSTSNDVLSTTVTRTFRTAFGSDQRFDLTASDMDSLATNGYFTVTGSNSAASQAVLGPELRATATTAHGTARVTVPAGCTFARSGGGNLDLTALATADAASDITNVSGTARGAIQYGIPNIGIALSSCGSGVSIAIPVASTITAGTVLDVLRSEDTNFSDNTTRLTTCTVSSSTCSFTTTSLSYFAATEPQGAPKDVDTTAPAAPTGLSATSSEGKITVSWTDPADMDLSTIRILHIDSVSGAATLRGTVNKGIQTYTDSGTDLTVDTTYTVGIQAQDSSGNRSTTPTVTVTVSAAKPAAADTTAPAAPTSLTATSAASKVTLTWTDSKDSDLKLIRILLLRGEATSILGFVNKGLQTFTYAGTDLIPGLPFTFAIEAEDTAGNKSSRVTTTITVDSGTAPTSPPTTTTTPTTTPAPTTPPADGAPKTTDTTTQPTTPTDGSPKTTDTATPTTPITPETELEKGIKADEPLPTEDPKASDLLKDAVKAITETLSPPCELTDAERQYLANAFTRSQGRSPASGGDLQFLCSLRADPEHPLDPTKAFPKYRNLRAEELALKNFVNFFRRPPSHDSRDRPLPPAVADKDWWAVKYMAYHLRLAPTARDLNGERTCLKLFLDRDVDLYKDGQKTRKTRGAPPRDLFDYDFIRACTYSGVRFVAAAGVE